LVALTQIQNSIDTNTKQQSKHITRLYLLKKKLPELDLDPDLVVKFPDPDPAKRS
jgi:hypothetical protein